MLKNRYDDKLREGNQLINELNPGNTILKIGLAHEIRKSLKTKSNLKILEIGSGEGDLTKYILKMNPSVNLIALDVS
tara:strand:- start:281 stop:511 length:231 start_codon:yes stop_codon:yes gene_type:complete